MVPNLQLTLSRRGPESHTNGWRMLLPESPNHGKDDQKPRSASRWCLFLESTRSGSYHPTFPSVSFDVLHFWLINLRLDHTTPRDCETLLFSPLDRQLSNIHSCALTKMLSSLKLSYRRSQGIGRKMTPMTPMTMMEPREETVGTIPRHFLHAQSHDSA